MVAEEDLTGGDFVRAVKQLTDLLGQIATVSPDEATRITARRAAEACFRGVVADASVMPDVIRANTNATTIMIAERVADFMRQG